MKNIALQVVCAYLEPFNECCEFAKLLNLLNSQSEIPSNLASIDHTHRLSVEFIRSKIAFTV